MFRSCFTRGSRIFLSWLALAHVRRNTYILNAPVCLESDHEGHAPLDQHETLDSPTIPSRRRSVPDLGRGPDTAFLLVTLHPPRVYVTWEAAHMLHHVHFGRNLPSSKIQRSAALAQDHDRGPKTAKLLIQYILLAVGEKKPPCT